MRMSVRRGSPEGEPRLPFDASECLWGNVLVRMFDSDTPSLCRMFELVMTSSHIHQIPSIRLQEPNDFSG